jgi:hypothetical protein
MSRLPALFVVDIKAEHIAKEAQKLNIPVLQWLILTLIPEVEYVIHQMMMLLNQSIKLSLVTAAVIEGFLIEVLIKQMH